MLRIVLTALLAAAVTVTPAQAQTAGGPSRADLKRIMRIHNECRTWSCVRRVRAARERRKARALRRRPFYGPVMASWYGPGFYGNRTACGQTLQTWTAGVAHKTLPCGTRLTICARRCAVTRVIDRGPYSGNRVFDLTAPVRAAIGAGPLAAVRYRIG